MIKTTGIGSLPFTDPDEAVKFVLKSGPDIPFWPQLPRRAATEKMLPQYADHMPCVEWNDEKKDVYMDMTDKYKQLENFYEKYLANDPLMFAFPQESAEGFYSFKKTINNTEAPDTVKGQITGPVTFTTGISDPDGRTLYSDPELRDAAVKMLERNACMQVQLLKESGAGKVVIFADEPVLSAYGSSAYVGISEKDVIGMLSQIFSAVSDAGAMAGMHVCGNSDWSMAMRSGVQMLNFDAFQYGTSLALYAEELREFLDNGGLIAWGIVPTTGDIEDETADSLTARLEQALDSLAGKGLDSDRTLKQSLLTPSCGAGSLNVGQTKKVFALLADLKTNF